MGRSVELFSRIRSRGCLPQTARKEPAKKLAEQPSNDRLIHLSNPDPHPPWPNLISSFIPP